MTIQIKQYLEANEGIEQAFREFKEKGWVTRLSIKHSIDREGNVEARLMVWTPAYRENPHPDEINPRLSELARTAAKCIEKLDLDGADFEPVAAE